MDYPQKRVIAFLLCLVVMIAVSSSRAPIEPSAQAQKHYASNHQSQNESAEEAIARYNWWLTLFTAILAVATMGLGGATVGLFFAGRNQLHLARAEFIATHRPKIIVYGVDVKLPGDSGNDRQVHFRYVNAGDTDALVTTISSRIQVAQKNRPPAGIELHKHTVISSPILVKSGEHGFAITPDSVSFINLVRSGQAEIVYCVGAIVYRDKNDIERVTGFCRHYDAHSERWLQVADQDYEYSY
jgi:hypothetical protein